MDPAPTVLFHRFQTLFDRIRLTFSVAAGTIKCNQIQLFPRLTSQSLGDRVREHIKQTGMQNSEFDMKAQQTRREGQTRQESRPGREANVKTGLLLETTHMATSFRRQRRESLRSRLSTWSIKITSFSLNNFAPEEFFGGAKSVSMNGPKFSNATAL